MDIRIVKNDVLFLIVCIGLAILAELSFFHGMIGVSYLIFITGFYAVFFVRYRATIFTHRRIGLLLMVSIWLLSASYFFLDPPFFLYSLNIFIIPFLIFAHIILITSPKQLEWCTPKFIRLMAIKVGLALNYDFLFISHCFNAVFKQMDEEKAQIVKRILLGLAIGIPILAVVTPLLMSADTVFENMLGEIPEFFVNLNIQEQLFRSIIVFLYLVIFFGTFQILTWEKIRSNGITEQQNAEKFSFDSIVVLTVLFLLNGIYLLFTVVQFTYFFGTAVQEGYTYATYARKGFSELIMVTLVNWTILITALSVVKETRTKLKITLQIMYSILIGVSGVMLASAFQRLSLYESAYGFTIDRILAHAFMIFLMIIFTYTFIRIWIEKLSLIHFYIIASLLFYTAINVVSLENIIVDNNIERYEQTGKIDVDYLSRLSSSGLEGMIQLYEKDPNYPDLQMLLIEKKEAIKYDDQNWQSYNIQKHQVRQKLLGLDLDN
ncbi:DUF4153 domain-containing protein [Aquibacillus rhizosphaerae]|uniref:DUF4173 domain-containing protein n=1 Tax=Aquibacillus rhizosphaerae TaxID=3051431 RepID=A0ABT7LAG1_9BACI|nr:DUF4173 domain-containing protein [Aquibacillus sp. LR5S19]MDL4842864.1 DUF4173 domain-containing protein [Aquibacillus sp. LR5S19]